MLSEQGDSNNYVKCIQASSMEIRCYELVYLFEKM